MTKLIISRLLTLFFLAGSLSLAAQDRVGSPELYDLFPDLPASVSNEDLRALQDNEENLIPEEYYYALGANSSLCQYVALGKIKTKVSTILLYAEVRNEPVVGATERLISIAKATFTTKTGEMVLGGSEYYLTMSGEDALKREGSITYNGTTVEFLTKSSDSTEETTIYNVGKKDLEFSERQ